ncbi:MAG: hypothetical protein LBM41_01555 [Ruminococcus sp.]|jgi:hypothetical protein|nr:hypothetical protein [Ruminococcus sp.]
MLKLSYRDKVIAIVITVVLLIAAGAVFVINPQLEKYQAKQLEVEAKEAEKVTVEEKIGTLDDIQMSIIRSAYDIGDLQEPFFLEEYHYQLEQLFHEYCDEAGVDIDSIDFNVTTEDITASQFMPSYNILAYVMKMNADLYGTLPQEVMDVYNNVSLPKKSTVEIGVFTINVTLGGLATWEDFRPFIDEIYDLDRTLMINTAAPEVISDPDSSGDGSAISVNLTLYTIVPMDRDTVVQNELDVAEQNGGLEERQILEDFIETLEEEANAEEIKEIEE